MQLARSETESFWDLQIVCHILFFSSQNASVPPPKIVVSEPLLWVTRSGCICCAAEEIIFQQLVPFQGKLNLSWNQSWTHPLVWRACPVDVPCPGQVQSREQDGASLVHGKGLCSTSRLVLRIVQKPKHENNCLLGSELSWEACSWKYLLFCLEMILWSCYVFLMKREIGHMGQIQPFRTNL